MSKYKAIKTEVDGIVFDSKKEAKYYKIFKAKEESGEISDLRRQVVYELIPAVFEDRIKHLKTKDKIERKRIQPAITYVADFVFVDVASGTTHVVDIKGGRATMTPVFNIKRKLMRAILGINIEIL